MLTLALAPGALAANEVGDAGDLRVTANDMGDSAVTEISGTLLDASDADLYRICLSDGASFSATTVGLTAVDTQLFLFDADGYGVYANDDWVTRGPNLPRTTASRLARVASTSSQSASTTATPRAPRARSSRTASAGLRSRMACCSRTGSAPPRR